MPMSDVFELTAAIFASLGGASAILFGLSNWLGRQWADRLLASERAKHEKEIEALKSKLRVETEAQLANLNQWLSIQKETHLKHHTDKLSIYRSVIDIVGCFIHELEQVALKRKPSVPEDILERFLMQRLQAYGYLAMLAPQNVMDRFDSLMDLILDVLYDNKVPTWTEVREQAIALLNAMRNDLGLDGGTIEYRGHR